MCVSAEFGKNDDGTSEERLSRRERERLQRRTEILTAAESVLIARGYHGTTVEEIAREAELSVGTIYNFFEGKDSLYSELMLSLAEDFMAEFETEVEGNSDPLGAITNLVKLRLSHYAQHRGFLRVVFEAPSHNRFDPGKGLPEQCRPVYDRYVRSVTAIFARGIEAGVFVEEAPIHLTYCLDGITDSFLAIWSHSQDFTLSTECIDLVTRMVLRAVRR